VHLVGFYYKNISRSTVLWKTNTLLRSLKHFTPWIPSHQQVEILPQGRNIYIKWFCRNWNIGIRTYFAKSRPDLLWGPYRLI